MKSKNYSFLNHIDTKHLQQFTDEEILDSLFVQNSKEFDKIHSFFLTMDTPLLPQSTDKPYRKYDLRHALINEMDSRMDNNVYSLEDIVKKIKVSNFSYFTGFLTEHLKKNPEKLPIILKKTASFKNSHDLKQLVKNTLELPFYQKNNINKHSLEVINQSLKIIESKGDMVTIELMYPYIANLDLRNFLLCQIGYNKVLTSSKHSNNNVKASHVIKNIPFYTSFDFDDAYILDNKLSSIKNIKDFYAQLLESEIVKAVSSYHLDTFISQSYQNIPDSHEYLDAFILKMVDEKRINNLSVLGQSIEYSPGMEDKLFSYIKDNNFFSDGSEHNKFLAIHTLTKSCPRLIAKLPKEMTQDLKFSLKLLEHNPSLFKFWDYSNVQEAYLFFRDPFFKTLDNLKFSQNNQKDGEFLGSFLKFFPLHQLDYTNNDIKKDIHNIIFTILPKDNLLACKIDHLDWSLKEKLINDYVLNYQNLFALQEKNKGVLYNSINENNDLAHFDFINTDRDEPLLASFLKFMEKSSPFEILSQLASPSLANSKTPLHVSMEVLYSVSQQDLLKFLIHLQNRASQYPMVSHPQTLQEFFSRTDIKNLPRNFYINNFAHANSQNISEGTFLEHCFIVIEEEKMNRMMPINHNIKKNTTKF